MLTFAYNYGTYYQIIVTDGTEENSFVYVFGTVQDIEISVVEARRLAEDEVVKRQPIIPQAI